ncbi:MAG: M23 family metallopeptidase [Clostridia bacterium]|nr:M23 family metallopeptidase [Clostridia bacterium]
MRTRRTQDSKNNNVFFRLTVFQLIVCAVLFGLLFGAAKLAPGLFETLRETFTEIMEQDCDLREVTFFPPQNAPDPAVQTEADRETADAEEESAAPETEDDGGLREEPVLQQGAGGEDMADADALKLVSFSVYETGDTPVMPVTGHVTSDFGERIHPIYGTEGFHAGRDIAADEGTPIYAALDGVVTAAGVGEKSGNYVKIDHGNGMETLYCHCSRLNVDTGVTVRKGDVIAFVGQTGLATGPHLHFEVHVNGAVCDPDYLLENACSVF